MRFRRYLRHLERSLEVPYPERESLIREISSHLEELYGELREGGMEEALAEARAIRTMALDEEFVTTIDEVHTPLVRQALAFLPAPLSTVIEHTGIGLLAGFIFVSLFVKERAMIEFFAEGGMMMLLLSLMGLVILFLVGERAFSLFIKKDHSETNLCKRILSLKFLGLACVLVGIIGTLVGYFRAFSAAERVAERHDGVFPIWEVSRIAMSTTIVGLTLALIALIAWYVFSSKANRIELMRLK